MLDSLVRVSRRVGRVTGTDTADAGTVGMSPMISRANRAFACICEQIQTGTDRLSVTRASVYADVPSRSTLDTYCGPATRGDKTGNESLAGLDLNRITSPAFRIGRSAYPREMRRAITTLIATPAGLAFRDHRGDFATAYD